jgi:hypothetical protein
MLNNKNCVFSGFYLMFRGLLRIFRFCCLYLKLNLSDITVYNNLSAIAIKYIMILTHNFPLYIKVQKKPFLLITCPLSDFWQYTEYLPKEIDPPLG